MRRGLLYEAEYKPQFSGHETFPLRYGWLKKVFDAVYFCEQHNKNDKTKDLFLNDDSIARFGVGKNMVASMRHWATASNVIAEDENRDIATTTLARLLLPDDGLDPWLENTSSLWAFHWNIASNSAKATYIWLFSHYNNAVFDRSTLVKMMVELCGERSDWKNMAEATIKRDVECLVRAYVNKPSKQDNFTEEQIESPLAELGLIQPVNKNDTFQIRRGHHASLGDGVFLYALVDFWQRYTKEARTLSLETIAYEPCSPGRVLCLDEDAVAERLYTIDDTSNGALGWSETAGLRQVIANKPLSSLDPHNFLKMDFHPVSKRRAA
ncbi:MAG: DUF4007 family protein [Bdellovibrionales bacterium]